MWLSSGNGLWQPAATQQTNGVWHINLIVEHMQVPLQSTVLALDLVCHQCLQHSTLHSFPMGPPCECRCPPSWCCSESSWHTGGFLATVIQWNVQQSCHWWREHILWSCSCIIASRRVLIHIWYKQSSYSCPVFIFILFYFVWIYCQLGKTP